MFLVAQPAMAIDRFTSVEESPFYRPQHPSIAQSWSCQPRKTCGQIGSCEEAVWYLYNCNWGGRLDGDSDGAPCEQLCGSNN